MDKNTQDLSLQESKYKKKQQSLAAALKSNITRRKEAQHMKEQIITDSYVLTLQSKVENLWSNFNEHPKDNAKDIINEVIDLLNRGIIQVSTYENEKYTTNQWIKTAILLYFKLNSNRVSSAGNLYWHDKVALKFDEHFDWNDTAIRAVPGAIVRDGAYIGKNVVLMPSFINIAAYVGDGTMIDTWSTIGSCAQIGKNCHISGGVGIGGVLEPISANPVIIEDNCFIGARSEIAEGVIIGTGSVISMGVYLGASTKIIDRETGIISYGYIPPYSVVVPGSTPSRDGVSLYCAVIVKKVDENTRKKVSINELLRQ